MSLATCLRTNTAITDMGKLAGGFIISPSAAVQGEKSAKPVVRLLPEHWVLPSTTQQGISITSSMWP